MKLSLGKLTREANFLSLAGNLVIAFFGFAGFALMARTFTAEVFGEWVLFIAAGSFVEMFRFGITNTAIIRYLSGASGGKRIQLIGSNVLISLTATLAVVILLLFIRFFFHAPIMDAGYDLFFTWYPLLALVNLPFNTAMVVMQADLRFGRLLLVKLINSGGFFVVILLSFLFFNLSLQELVFLLIAVNMMTSVYCIVNNWDGFRFIMKASRETNKEILNFGKYTTFTLIGTNLLRSADTIIISLSPLGTAAVALYSIPLKLTEIQQIPLRSFVATAFPRMSKASIEGKIDEVKEVFYTYSGAMTYLFFFISLVTFVFAEYFVLLLGGQQYMGIEPITGVNTATIVRIFSLYGLILPIDRMTGIGLDSINRPDKNFIKVAIMVIANVAGDLIAVFIFESLALVAVGSIVFTAIGVLVGYQFLHRELNINIKQLFIAGMNFYKGIYEKLRHA